MRTLLYQVLSTSFCVIVIISNILSAKMVILPWIHLMIPAGLITYPLTFLLSDLVTELFGAKKARLMIYLALGMNLLSLGMIQVGLWLPTHSLADQTAFQAVLGLSGIRIFSSLASYAVSQVVDVQLYAAIKRWTGPKWLWLRNNGSTCASQLVDTILIDLLFLWWGLGMSAAEILPIMLFSYLYKALFSFACTPLFYLLLFLTRSQWRTAAAWLGSIFSKPLPTKGTL